MIRKHTYTYESYNASTQKYFLRNPHGKNHAQVTFAGLKDMGSNLAYLDGTRTKMQRIDPSDSSFSVTDASAPGDSDDGSGLTAIDSAGDVKLFKDGQSNLYVGPSAGSSVPVMISASSLVATMNGRTVLVAEQISGVNKLLWKDGAGVLEEMNFNSAWQFVSSGDSAAPSTSAYNSYEKAFNIDVDSDGYIGGKLNKVPVANAGSAQAVNEGSVVTLDASGSSDGDSDPLTYAWTAPSGITLSSTTAAKPTFTAPEVDQNTNYTIKLVVNDGTANSSESTVVVTVNHLNKLPVANAGSNKTVNEGSFVALDASGSSDPDPDTLTYAWTAPAGITLSSTTFSKPSFIAPEVDENTSYTSVSYTHLTLPTIYSV